MILTKSRRNFKEEEDKNEIYRIPEEVSEFTEGDQEYDLATSGHAKIISIKLSKDVR